MWRAVVTVDCTTMMSAPASTASGLNRLVVCGVNAMAAIDPDCLISWTRSPIRCSCTGSLYTSCKYSVTSPWSMEMISSSTE